MFNFRRLQAFCGVFALVFAVSVFAQDVDTAYVQFLVNVGAKVTATHGDIVVSIDAEGN